MNPKQVKQIITEGQKSGSIHLTGTREERKTILRNLRKQNSMDSK